MLQIQADTLAEKVRLLAAKNDDSGRSLAEVASDTLERPISREYIRRLFAGEISENQVDEDVLLALAIYWDVPLSHISEAAYERSRKVLALHQKAKKMNPRRSRRGQFTSEGVAEAA